MQNLKLSLVACVAVLAARPLLVSAADTDAQKAARTALEQQTTAGRTGAPVLIMPPSASDEEIAKAREALHEKLRELQAQQSPESQAPSPASESAAERKQRLAAEKAARKEAALEAKRQKAEAAKAAADAKFLNNAGTASEDGKTDEAKKTKKGDAKTAAAPPAVKPAEPVFAPIGVPETGFSTTKTERLQKLLDDYKADRISAEEYHQLRAKALQEP